MFAMNYAAGANPLSGEYGFDCGPIARVYEIGANLTYLPDQCPDLKPCAGLAGQTDDPRPSSLEAFRIRTQPAHCANHVFEAVGIQSRDQVDKAVLKTAFTKTIDYVKNTNWPSHANFHQP